MSLCLVPDCLSKNATEAKFCQKCGAKLLLQERYRAIKIIGQGGFGKTFLARDEAKPSQPYCVIKQSLPDSQEPEYLEKASILQSITSSGVLRRQLHIDLSCTA